MQAHALDTSVYGNHSFWLFVPVAVAATESYAYITSFVNSIGTCRYTYILSMLKYFQLEFSCVW